MELLLAAGLAFLAAHVLAGRRIDAAIRRRWSDAGNDLAELRAGHAASGENIRVLRARIEQLERALATDRHQPSIAEPLTDPPPAVVLPEPVRESLAVEPPVVKREPAPPIVPDNVAPPPALTPVVIAPPVVFRPLIDRSLVEGPLADAPIVDEPVVDVPSWMERLRGSSEDWETVIGGSLLNKVGVLTLVIGLALFVGYSLTRLGPAGRIGVGLAVSVAMLAAGVFAETRAGYRIFARGLIGGGWAGLYFTTYAMHGLEAARVVDDPFAGAALLGLVSAGMIAHSLRYRSQEVTGLAYFIAFITVGISESSTFAWLALLPLCGSLLWIAARFAWSQMAVGGLIASYVTFAWAPHGTFGWTGDIVADVTRGQHATLLLWVLFEVFSVAMPARGARDSWTLAIGPLNAAGFALVSARNWHVPAGAPTAWFLGSVALAYLGVAAVRARVVARQTDDEGSALRLVNGGYEGTLVLASLLGAAAWVMLGQWVASIGLLAQAQGTFVAGIALRTRFVRALGLFVMLLATASLAVLAITHDHATAIAGLSVFTWMPLVGLAGLLLHANDEVVRNRHDVLGEEAAYSFLGTLLLVLLIARQSNVVALGSALTAFALVLLEFGVRRHVPGYRVQAYGVGALALVALLQNNAFPTTHAVLPSVLWLVGPAAICCFTGFRFVCDGSDRLTDVERRRLGAVTTWASSSLIAVALWRAIPLAQLGVALTAYGLLWLVAGARARWIDVRQQAYVLFTLGLGATTPMLFAPGDVTLQTGVATSAVALATGATGWVLLRRLSLPLADRERLTMWRAGTWASAILLAALIGRTAPREWAGPAGMGLALVLIAIGLQMRRAEARVQGYLVAVASFGATAAFNGFQDPGTWSSALGPLATVGALNWAAAWLVGRDSYARAPETERAAVWTNGTLAGTLLFALLIWKTLPASLVSGSWALLGIVCLELGVTLRTDTLRAQGHAIVLAAVARLFLVNFTSAGETIGLSHRMLTVAPLIALAVHLRVQGAALIARDAVSAWESRLDRAYLLLPGFLAAVLIRFELGPELAGAGWVVLALLVVRLGWSHHQPLLRDQGLALAGLASFSALAHGFTSSGRGAFDDRLVAGLVVVASLIVTQATTPRPTETTLSWRDRHARALFAIVATLVLSVMVFGVSTSRMLTIAWGLEGVAVLILGFLTHERSLRWSGLVLLALSVARAFLYDRRELDTPYQILSFIGLGVAMIAVSWVYTRFRSQLQRYF